MARRFPSESSLDSELSGENSITSVQEDEDTYHLSLKLPYLDKISRFVKIKQNERYDMKPSWSGMNVTTTTKNQLDMQILGQRLIYLLESATVQAKIMAILPQLVENDGAIIRRYMPCREADFVIQCFSRQNLASESRKQIRNSLGYKVDKNMMQAYRLLTMNHCFPLYLEKYPPNLSQFVLSFLAALKEFGFYTCKHVELTACEYIDKEARLRSIFELMRERRYELKRLHAAVDEIHARFSGRLNRKTAQIEDMQQRLDDTINYFNKLKHDCLQRSDKILYQSSEISNALQEELAEAAIDAKVTYVNTLDAHLTEERMLRTRKIKLEAQLAMWLTKYDTDLGEKQHILDELTEGYERDNAELQELECLLVEQETVFFRYIDEEEDAELNAIKEKLYVIASKRAAKIIQKYWREYLQRKLNRKPSKVKKVKKGKKTTKKKK